MIPARSRLQTAKGKVFGTPAAAGHRVGLEGFDRVCLVEVQHGVGLRPQPVSPLVLEKYRPPRVSVVPEVSSIVRRARDCGSRMQTKNDKLSRRLRGVAQPGSAPALGAGGRRFKSSHPDHPSAARRAAVVRVLWGFRPTVMGPL
jgi:hypothetical protein